MLVSDNRDQSANWDVIQIQSLIFRIEVKHSAGFLTQLQGQATQIKKDPKKGE